MLNVRNALKTKPFYHEVERKIKSLKKPIKNLLKMDFPNILTYIKL